ncbi:MAG: ATP-grasp domain-containing protein [Alphaproteobacteria bacterium]|nr:ATP-grasp domain-containing protein [Alphaproteobacteria bacterium]
MKRICIATDEDNINDPENLLISKILNDMGAKAELTIWDKQESLFKDCDYVLIRSCWNYHKYPDKFIQWINSLNIPTINAKSLIQWNIHKKYLLELEKHNIEIPKTYVIQKENVKDFNFNIFDEFVIKPAISASGYLTYKYNKNDSEKVNSLLPLYSSDVLIQEFIPEVIQEGEISFVFFNNSFSHAVKKIPSLSDFRSQARYGGTVKNFIPNQALKNKAVEIVQKIMDITNECPFYMRLDAVLRKNNLVIMEIEAIEPRLFLSNSNCDIFKKAWQSILP